MKIVDPTEHYPPLPPLVVSTTAAGKPLRKPRYQHWAWVECDACGEVQAKPLTAKGTVLVVDRRCVRCGAKGQEF